MDRNDTLKALQVTGSHLSKLRNMKPIRIVLCGGVAAMLAGHLPASRVTHDCDVVSLEPDEDWTLVLEVSHTVADQFGFAQNWLNRDSSMYAHLLPLGWHDRLESVGAFGPLQVDVICRQDLMAMKLMGSPDRPQDIEDIQMMVPTNEDICFMQAHLNRLQTESLNHETYDGQQAILDSLEIQP